jgi:hypothetical protein
MKTDIENNDLSHESYVVEIDGKIESRHGIYFEALKALLKHELAARAWVTTLFKELG